MVCRETARIVVVYRFFSAGVDCNDDGNEGADDGDDDGDDGDDSEEK